MSSKIIDEAIKQQYVQNTSNVSGNVVVPIWHYYLIRSGRPDHIAITILADLMHGYFNEGTREFQYGYWYFCPKFNYSRTQVREALVRLESKGLVSRHYYTIPLPTRCLNNEMFITLYPENLEKLAKNIDLKTNDNFRKLQEITSIVKRQYPKEEIDDKKFS